MEIYHVKTGIHKLIVTDSSGFSFELGPPFTEKIDPSTKRIVIEFSPDEKNSRKPIGLIGTSSFEGVTSMGIIFMDTGCRPLNGNFIYPEGSSEAQVVEKVVDGESSSGGLIAGIIITVVLLVIVIAVAVYLFLYLRKNKRQILALETEKAEWDRNSKLHRLRIVNGTPGDLENIDDSARLGLKAGSKRYENGEDDLETVEVRFEKRRYDRDSEDPTYSLQDCSFSEC